MNRFIINSVLRSSKSSVISSQLRRSLTTSSKASSHTSSYSRWILPSSIFVIGLTGYYLSKPVALDTQPVKQSKDSIKTKSLEKAQESTDSTTSSSPASNEPVTEGQEQSSNGNGAEEEEHGQSAAYNPETGEINWDCPCLGGMANGPCGEEFKEAFSCFVYSEAEPKGFDCIEKFKNMQNCFRRYPDVYSEEIRDDEGPVDDLNTDQSDVYIPEETTATVVETTETIIIPVEESTEGTTPITEEVSSK